MTSSERFAALREKAGDGSTDFIVEVRQSDLRAIFSLVRGAGNVAVGWEKRAKRAESNRTVSSDVSNRTVTGYVEVLRDALREFAYRPGQPVFSRYEGATAALDALAAERDVLEAALREIANPQEWQRGHRAPFEVARAALAGVTDTRGE